MSSHNIFCNRKVSTEATTMVTTFFSAALAQVSRKEREIIAMKMFKKTKERLVAAADCCSRGGNEKHVGPASRRD